MRIICRTQSIAYFGIHNVHNGLCCYSWEHAQSQGACGQVYTKSTTQTFDDRPRKLRKIFLDDKVPSMDIISTKYTMKNIVGSETHVFVLMSIAEQ